MASMAYADGFTGDTMCDFSMAPLVEKVGQKPYPMALHDLQERLHEQLGPEHLHLGKELASIDGDGDQVTAHFTDGSSATGGVLIGADGTRSVTRDYVREQPTEHRYAGYVNWNGLVAATEERAPLDRWTMLVGKDKRVSLMPVADGRFYFFCDVPLPAGLPAERAEYRGILHGYFAGWAPQVHLLIDSLDVERLNRVEIHDIEPFHDWVRGRVVLLGDAAHSTTPDIGEGGCQAWRTPSPSPSL